MNNKTIGGILILLGILFLFHNILPFSLGGIIFTWWPLFFIILGVHWINMGGNHRMPGIIFLVLGLVFQITEFDILPFSPWSLWPLVLVAIGANMIFSRVSSRQDASIQNEQSYDENQDDDEREVSQQVSSQNMLSNTVVMSDQDTKVDSKEFEGGSVSVIMGSVKLDLRDVKLKDNVVALYVTSFLGSLEITLPNDIRVVNFTNSIFGDVSATHESKKTGEVKVLEIRGSAILGDVRIR